MTGKNHYMCCYRSWFILKLVHFCCEMALMRSEHPAAAFVCGVHGVPDAVRHPIIPRSSLSGRLEQTCGGMRASERHSLIFTSVFISLLLFSVSCPRLFSSRVAIFGFQPAGFGCEWVSRGAQMADLTVAAPGPAVPSPTLAHCSAVCAQDQLLPSLIF